MGIPLRKDEKVMWTSKIGRNYRTFILVRDSLLISLIVIGIYYLLSNFSKLDGPIMPTIIAFFVLCIFPIYNQIGFILVTYTVTSSKIVIKKGLIFREFKTIEFDRLTDIEIKQSLFEKIIDSGSIYFYTANDSQTDGEDVPAFKSIDAPFKVYEIIQHYNKK